MSPQKKYKIIINTAIAIAVAFLCSFILIWNNKDIHYTLILKTAVITLRKPLFNMSYTSTRKFRIWGYSVSLSYLLLRSSYSKEEKTDKFNIDIEFTDVDYLDIPITLHGISIEEIKENLPEKFAKYKGSSQYRVFRISSNANHYIVAGNYLVGKNKWDPGKNRMVNLFLKYDEILATTYPSRG